MEISKMLTASTDHVSGETKQYLDNAIMDSSHGVIVYDKPTYGWFIVVSEDFEDRKELIPEELFNLLLFAKDLNCEWLMLDVDGEHISYLPYFC
jgi:hypothetical protein